MHIDNLSDLPDWDDDRLPLDDEGEEWKPNPTREACRALYQKWKEIMLMLKGALDTSQSEEAENISYTDDLKYMVLGDAYEVGIKIRSSEAGDMYVLRMENAAIIRKNAQHVASSLLTLGAEDETEEQYVDLIRAEIDQFRELFKIWIGTFEKDEYTDDWGLFV